MLLHQVETSSIANILCPKSKIYRYYTLFQNDHKNEEIVKEGVNVQLRC